MGTLTGAGTFLQRPKVHGVHEVPMVSKGTWDLQSLKAITIQKAFTIWVTWYIKIINSTLPKPFNPLKTIGLPYKVHKVYKVRLEKLVIEAFKVPKVPKVQEVHKVHRASPVWLGDHRIEANTIARENTKAVTSFGTVHPFFYYL